MTQAGHLIFKTAANHNITFQSNSGGYINLDGENFKAIVEIVSSNTSGRSRISQTGAPTQKLGALIDYFGQIFLKTAWN